MILQSDDVVMSTATATTEHRVSVGANPTGPVCRNHDAAVIMAKELARVLQVDAWLTEDHTHFLKIASHRPLRCGRAEGAR